MGVEILWFMPVTPISVKDRKGTLGSYYAVQDYTGINNEFGSMQDFKDLVGDAHHLGFKVIIDWVANHSGNDNIWIEKHPDFYCYDESNNIIHPHGWEDVSKLNFDNLNMQESMIEAMKFWVDNCDIDGFRCDMAHLVPLEFWKKARTVLNEAKPELFWLAECEEPHYHEAFDATYTWKWMHATEKYYKNEIDLNALFNVLYDYDNSFNKDAFRVYFTSNHDENSWNGSEYEKYGPAARALAVFSCTWNGIPMIYTGQEMPNQRRLQFFDKDHLDWKPVCQLHDFYKILLQLRKKNSSLRAADNSVTTFKIDTNQNDKIFAYLRRNGNDEVMVILNLSGDTLNVECHNHLLSGIYREIFNNSEIEFEDHFNLNIQPWHYLVYEKKLPV